MRKNHASPTVSSHQKTAPPVNIRDRVIRLTEAVNELRANAENEERHKDVLDKVTMQNYSVLNSQVKSLKKAFNTLADVVMEELDSFKSEILKDFQESSDLTYHKVEDLSTQVHKLHHDRQEQKSHIISLEQEIRDRFRSLEKRHEENFEHLQTSLETSREDNKILFEKLKVVINNNSAQLELLSKDNQKIHSELSETRSKTISDSSSFKNFQKKVLELEDTIRATRQELTDRTAETHDHSNIIRQTKSEMQAILKIQTELNKKMEETNMKVFEKVDSSRALSEHKLSEVNRSIAQLRQEVQDNLEELAQIHKDSSTQIILDFEKAITSLNSDTKVIFKKFGSVEENLIKIRDELSIMVTEQHHILIRKNEHLEKAFYEICRKLNIPNPLVAY